MSTPHSRSPAAYLDHAGRAVGLLPWPKLGSLLEVTALYAQCNAIVGVGSSPICVFCVFLNNKCAGLCASYWNYIQFPQQLCKVVVIIISLQGENKSRKKKGHDMTKLTQPISGRI